MGIGDWGLGIGDWGLGPIPNPQFDNLKKFLPNIFINKKLIKNVFIYITNSNY